MHRGARPRGTVAGLSRLRSRRPARSASAGDHRGRHRSWAALSGTPMDNFRLPNGLEVVLEENHAAPVVAFQAWVKVGSADEPPRLAGVAHLAEHMFFKGTQRRGVG